MAVLVVDLTHEEAMDKPREVSVLTYNVWFAENVALEARMRGIGEVVRTKAPDVVCFQEATHRIWQILQMQNWTKQYRASPVDPQASYFVVILVRDGMEPTFHKEKFPNSTMGRELVWAQTPGNNFAFGTAHLESYTVDDRNPHSAERREQLRRSLRRLEVTGAADVFFAGDTNWNERLDGQVQMPEGFTDVWQRLHPGEPGFTYDAKQNDMLRGYLRQRFDRIFVKLENYRPVQIELVGKTPLPGVTYMKTAMVRGRMESASYPVLPSDHYGVFSRFVHI